MKKLSPNFWVVLLCIFSSTLTAQNFSNATSQQLDHLVETNDLLPPDAQWQITSQSVSRISGIQHIYFSQVFNDLEIYGTESGIHLMPNGQVISKNSRFIKGPAEKLFGATSPGLNASQAVQAAALQLNYKITQPLSILEKLEGKSMEGLLSDGGISMSPIPVKLMYTLTEDDRLVLSWDISIEEKAKENWWSLRIDATTGEIINRANWVASCGLEHDHSQDIEKLDFNDNLYDIPNYQEMQNAMPAACTECYEVFALPLESPYYGSRTIETKPADLVASPYGWHDTNGAPGAEYTVTRGNNANAYEDGNNPGYQPDGGANLDFTGYPFSQVYTYANQYEDAAITNLFYINNVFHDIMYRFGFDEVSGNFQENNYGNGGAGNDSVRAEAQDGSGTCNANFMTPPDGQKPRMQMYICGDKDGDYDTLVILHEYGHGVSNRLTGGPARANCLQNTEQMGEGWSDFFGALLTIQPGDVGTDRRAVGTYLFGQGIGGPGIRDYPYSTDMSINPQTYNHIKTAAVPHGVGSVWAQMLWEVTWALIDEHGYDTNPYNFAGDMNIDKGNTIALALVTEGMKLQPCSPGFVDGRDAIFAADQAIYGGANECLLWEAFAKRGLGYSANQGSSNSRSDGTQAFDTPTGVADLSVIEEVCVSEGVVTGLTGGTPSGGTYSGTGVTDDGNGSTFTFDAAVAGVGTHTITYEVPAGQCSTASSATDTITVIAVPNAPATTGVTDFCVGKPVTVLAVPNDPTNTIKWYNASTGGSLLFEGASYTFTPTGTMSVYAQENTPGSICQSARTKTDVTMDSIDPTITCPSDMTVTVPTGQQYSIPDFSGDVTVTDNCTPAPVVTQSPVAGTMVGLGNTTITMTATDAANNSAICTFVVTVDELIGIGDNEFYNNILLYPNPTRGIIVLTNKTNAKLENAIITDVKGRIIKTIDLSAAGMETNISLENLASGMYFIKINTESANIVKRIIKQ